MKTRHEHCNNNNTRPSGFLLEGEKKKGNNKKPQEWGGEGKEKRKENGKEKNGKALRRASLFSKYASMRHIFKSTSTVSEASAIGFSGVDPFIL